MRIFGIEIRFGGPPKPAGGPPALPEAELIAAFAVPDTHPLWRATHQVLDMVEAETVRGARKYVANTNQCIGAVGAGEGVDLVRLRLHELRDAALKVRAENAQRSTSNIQ